MLPTVSDFILILSYQDLVCLGKRLNNRDLACISFRCMHMQFCSVFHNFGNFIYLLLDHLILQFCSALSNVFVSRFHRIAFLFACLPSDALGCVCGFAFQGLVFFVDSSNAIVLCFYCAVIPLVSWTSTLQLLYQFLCTIGVPIL